MTAWKPRWKTVKQTIARASPHNFGIVLAATAHIVGTHTVQLLLETLSRFLLMSACSICWPKQTLHKKKGRNQVTHKQVGINVIRRYHSSLNPSKSPDVLRRLHEDDEKTKWFGVTRETSGQTLFEDHGRYAALMSETAQIGDAAKRYPQLVSFIGVTNAGKSTLIKMLIERNVAGEIKAIADCFPAPPVGSAINDSLATSGDVHLYADPATHLDPLPILFADCEGFEGGERIPLGSRSQGKGHQQGGRTWVKTRPIRWANTDETRRREYAVSALYPRVLYSFSDCVVFVLRNPKTFGSAVLTKLIGWGAAALERSVNQPALPHCIVVLNGSDSEIDRREWDSQCATESLLSSVDNAFDRIEGVPQFRELARYWQLLGRRVTSVEDLLLCYYGSFKVIRVPAGPQYTLIDQQMDKLHTAIRGSCMASHQAKRRARLLTDAGELDEYLQSGFDHFTSHLDVPFNFMQVSLARNPIPRDFGGHILQLYETLSARIPSREPTVIRWKFWKLSPLLGSCVLLDCARFRKGQLHQLFDNYVGFFDYAMTEYLQLHCPCSFVSEDGARACKSVKARHHVKGHQDEHGIIAAGDYKSTFDDDFAQQWMEQLRATIEKLHLGFSRDVERLASLSNKATVSEECIAFALHVTHLRQFYQSIGPATWIRSHSTCFCCLRDVPQHLLPCGHALCDRCAQACGTLSRTTLKISWCPLHQDSTRWAQPKIIRYKPSSAGVRILALDGGGIRGIVQLEILRGVEQALGGHFSVQTFFDLVIGTGTGGLIAVALASGEKSLNQCQEMFAEVCKSAYAAKNPGEALVNRLSHTFASRPRYKTSPLYGALKKHFSGDMDFFGASEQFRSETRVAVTTTDSTRNKTRLVGNYRRANVEDPVYDFERPHDPALELKTWQAVYATMADPLYFAPLRLNKQYNGGGLTCVNPARVASAEARKIWPDVVEPDLLLSLGTGQNRMAILAELSQDQSAADTSENESRFGERLKKAQRFTKWLLRSDNDVLHAERTWQGYISGDATDISHRERRKRIRFNIDLGKEEPPAHDQESQIRRISTLVREKLQDNSRQMALKNVAYRLVATSFFFRVLGQGKRGVVGHVCCRFEQLSDEVKRLGRFLNDQRTDVFEPFFSVSCIPNPSAKPLNVALTRRFISRMIEDGIFESPKMTVSVDDNKKTTSIDIHFSQYDKLEAEGYPISGFPRKILESSDVLRLSSGARNVSIAVEKLNHPPSKISQGPGNWQTPSSFEEDVLPAKIITSQKIHSETQTAENMIQTVHGSGDYHSKVATDVQEAPPPYDNMIRRVQLGS